MMSNDGYGEGFLLGSVIVGVPLGIGVLWLANRSYQEGLSGSELMSQGLIFGRTSNDVLVLPSEYEKGRTVRLLFQNFESRIYRLEQACCELRAGYVVVQGKLEKLETEIINLWNEAHTFPELRKRLEQIYGELIKTKNHQAPKLNIIV